MDTMMPAFQVSVVIPSWKRHDEVRRAVGSVLAQSPAVLEVVVSNDGPDSEKRDLLCAFNDDRIRYIEAPRRKSASATRNYGIKKAKGDWVALLDDDDIWLPDKLKAQFAALMRSGQSEAILAGVEVVYKRGRRSYIRPAQSVQLHTPVDEFLFCGFGGANTSTLIAPRWLFKMCPFDEGLERHEDWSWLLQAGKKLGLVVAPEEICERHLAPGEGLSRSGDYAFSQQWYERHKGLMSAKARASFVSNILSRKAAYDLQLSALPWLIREHFVNAGSLGGTVQLLGAWALPGSTRNRVKTLLGRN